MYECPHDECDYESESENGVSRHYGYAHEGSIARVERECRHPDCDMVYEAYQSRLKNGRDTYCSRECRDDDCKSFVPSGEDHVQYDASTHVERECEVCGETWTMPRSRVERDGRRGGVFCSRECDAKWRSETFRGENHYNWMGGRSSTRGPSWNSQRKKALERVDCTCEHPNCSKTPEDIGRNPDVHHIIPYNLGIETGYFDSHEEANDLENLLVLCDTHHKKLEPSKQLQTPI